LARLNKLPEKAAGSKVQSVEALVDRVEALKGREKLEIMLIRPGETTHPRNC
jgi:hypothetical protein